MNLKSMVTLLSIVFYAHSVHSQHISSTSALDFGVGKSNITTNINVGYNYFLNEKIHLGGLINYEWGKPNQFNYNSFSADLVGAYSVLNIQEVIYFNAAAGPTITYDKLNPMAVELVNYGGIVRVETEAYINEQFAIVLSGSQSYLFKHDLGSNRFLVKLGIRYVL